MKFPAPDNHCPGKDEMADYLEAYVSQCRDCNDEPMKLVFVNETDS